AMEFIVQTEYRAFSTLGVAPDASLADSFILYQSIFTANEWWGDLKAIQTSLSDLSNRTELWSAADVLDSTPPADRNLFAINPDGATGQRGVPFTWTSLTTWQKEKLNTLIGAYEDNLGAQRVDYFRGARTQELHQGGQFRTRKHVLGDIVNSDTLIVSKQNYGYSALPGADGSTYNTYLNSAAYRDRPEILLVGANDGFLHAFASKTGEELFGIMPNSVFSNISTLTNHNYAHRYFMDGQITVSDAYINDKWTTVALASTGTGGPSVFAFDIGNPSAFSKQDILWEFDQTSDQDMGHMLSTATIARLAGGQWVAIFSNGAENQRGQAVLYITDLATGQLLKKIDLGRGSGSEKNALFAPNVIDYNLDGIADAVYAGDAKGNLWKIDISDKDPSMWRSSFGTPSLPVPLFTACTTDPCSSGQRQPITQAPKVGLHPIKGVMVYFGTGQFFDWYDRAVSLSDPANTFYAVWDQGQPVSGRSQLLQQRFLHAGTRADGSSYRLSSANPIEWHNGSSGQWGWYIDLIDPNLNAGAGERLSVQPRLINENVSFISIRPHADPCETGGNSFITYLNALDGGHPQKSHIDINKDGQINDSDLITLDGKTYAASGVMLSEIVRGSAIIRGSGLEASFFNLSNSDIKQVTTTGAKKPIKVLWRRLDN
ncbi:MAG: PilC/PilY family type IV pilus protein, partial [Gammaproteobacteria bacterium]